MTVIAKRNKKTAKYRSRRRPIHFELCAISPDGEDVVGRAMQYRRGCLEIFLNPHVQLSWRDRFNLEIDLVLRRVGG